MQRRRFYDDWAICYPPAVTLPRLEALRPFL